MLLLPCRSISPIFVDHLALPVIMEADASDFALGADCVGISAQESDLLPVYVHILRYLL
jgi:hypothetical protein